MYEKNTNKLTEEEKAYYTPDLNDIDLRLANQVDHDTNSRIQTIAALDILYRKPVKTEKDFQTKAEYECYKTYLHDIAPFS